MNIIGIKKLRHNGTERVKLSLNGKYAKGSMIYNALMSIEGCYYSSSLQAWNFAAVENYKELLEQAFAKIEGCTFHEDLCQNDEDKTTVKPIVNKTNIIVKPNRQNISIKKSDKNLKRFTLILDKLKKRIYVKHTDEREIWAEIKKINKSYWNTKSKQWHIAGNNENYKALLVIAKKLGVRPEIKEIKPLLETEQNPTVKLFLETLTIKNYSKLTINSYLPHFKQFVQNFKEVDLRAIAKNQIDEYVFDAINVHKYGAETQKHLISAIKFYYEKILGRKTIYFALDKPFEITPSRIKILFEDFKDTLDIISSNTEKLLALLAFVYGLRSKEMAELTLDNLKKLINKTTQAEQKQYILNLVKAYYYKHKPLVYLFEKIDKSKVEQKNIVLRLKNIIQQHKIYDVYNYIMQDAATQVSYAPTTKKHYTNLFRTFLKWHDCRHPSDISNQEIRQYILNLKTKYNLSASYINSVISALKFYYIYIVKRLSEYHIWLRPRAEKQLPEVLSTQEVAKMIESTLNIKHKTLIAMLYASGLRRSELINMRLRDIDFERKTITIKQGKGKKDRQTPLAQNLESLFAGYIEQYKPKEYIFEGATGEQYSATSLAKVVKAAAERAQMKKTVTPHALRHSFATHLLESAVDIRYIQQLLGHNNLKTTERYTHVAKTAQNIVKSPLDKINFDSAGHNKNKPP